MTTPFGLAAGGANIGAGLYGLFGNQKNPADAASPYLNQIGQQTGQYYNPYINAGQSQIPGLQQQYSDLMNNPGGKLNDIGSNFQQSPGFKFALQQALQGAGHASAAGGMAGSPQHEQENMQLATQLGNQDYYNYLQQATGLYGQGLTGGQNMMGLGANAANSQAQMIAQQLAAQAQNAAQGQYEQNNKYGNAFSNIGAGLGQMAFL